VITQINIGAALKADWYSAVERQLNFALASVHWQIISLEVDLLPQSTPSVKSSAGVFQCTLTAKLRGGRREQISVYNKDPLISVGDAAARLRRIIARDRQLGLLGRAS
jgi:hypothetical protein